MQMAAPKLLGELKISMSLVQKTYFVLCVWFLFLRNSLYLDTCLRAYQWHLRVIVKEPRLQIRRTWV